MQCEEGIFNLQHLTLYLQAVGSSPGHWATMWWHLYTVAVWGCTAQVDEMRACLQIHEMYTVHVYVNISYLPKPTWCLTISRQINYAPFPTVYISWKEPPLALEHAYTMTCSLSEASHCITKLRVTTCWGLVQDTLSRRSSILAGTEVCSNAKMKPTFFLKKWLVWFCSATIDWIT